MTDLMEQSTRLTKLQAELEHLKNGVDTIQEFAVSALRAIEFLQQHESQYEQTQTTIQKVSEHLENLKATFEDSQLQSTLHLMIATVTRTADLHNHLQPQLQTLQDTFALVQTELRTTISAEVTRLTTQLQSLAETVSQGLLTHESRLTATGQQIEGLTQQLHDLQIGLQTTETLMVDRLAQVQAELRTTISAEVETLKTQQQLMDEGISKRFLPLEERLQKFENQVSALNQQLQTAQTNLTSIDQEIKSFRNDLKNQQKNSNKKFEDIQNLILWSTAIATIAVSILIFATTLLFNR